MRTLRSGRGEYPLFCNDNIALVFASDVFQIIRSTPGVFFPSFSVTRLTANDFPLNEWVSSHCKGFYLAISALLCCLHNTRLQLSYLTSGTYPIDCLPIVAGWCTRNSCCIHLLFLPLLKFCLLSCDERPRGSRLVFT